MKSQFTIGSFGLITDINSKVLLCLRNDYELWNLPGGGVEKGESPWEAVVREVNEETGLKVEVEELLGIYNKPDNSDLVFFFKCKIIDGKIKINTEAKQIDFFALHEIPKNTSPKQVERIKDFFHNKHRPILKNQYGKSSIELIKEGKL